MRDGEEVPDPIAAETFKQSKVDWSERDRHPHREILEWHRRLIGLRRELPQLAAGPAPEVRCDVAAGWLTVERAGTLLAANVGGSEVSIELPGGTDRWRLEVASREDVADPRTTGGRLVLPAMTAALLLEASGARELRPA
jgi:maltooligosyltrehalose trehalohydrolase